MFMFLVLCLVFASSFESALFLILCSYDKFWIRLNLREIRILKKKYFGETNWKKLLENWAKQPTPSLVKGVSLEFSPAYPNFMTLLTILSCIAELSQGWSFFFFSVSKSGMKIEGIRLDIPWKTIVFNKIVATETGHHLHFLSLPIVNIKCSLLVIQELPSVYSL